MEIIKKLAVNNFSIILASTSCGCFGCLQIFSPREVINWREDQNGRTGLCPICTSPSVLGDGAEEIEKIDTDFLKKVCEGENE